MGKKMETKGYKVYLSFTHCVKKHLLYAYYIWSSILGTLGTQKTIRAQETHNL